MMNNRRALLFAPYSIIWPHVNAEAATLLKLKKGGFDVNVLRCDGLFQESCSMHQSFRTTNEKFSINPRDICKKCISISGAVDKTIESNVYQLRALLPDRAFEEARIIVEAIPPNRFQDFRWQGIPIGRLAFYEFLIKNKLTSEIVPDHLLPDLKDRFRDGLVVAFAASKFLSENNFDVIFTYNRLYSINAIFLALAEIRGIKCYSLELGGPLNDMEGRLRIDKDPYVGWRESKSEDWLNFKSQHLSRREIIRITNHLKSLTYGLSPWVYSQPFKKYQDPNYLQNYFGILENQLVALVTLSSADELFALDFIHKVSSKLDYFEKQRNWIVEIVAAAKIMPNIFFIIRPHPREFPNKREGVMSQNALRLKDFLESLDLPKNVKVNWPDELFSLYNFVRHTDLLINMTSSVGAEFAAFGVPTLIQNTIDLEAYPPEISIDASQKPNLVDAIYSSIKNHHQQESQVSAFRWFYFKYYRSTTNAYPRFSKYSWKFLFIIIKIGIRFRYFGILTQPFVTIIARFTAKLQSSNNSVVKMIKIDGPNVRNAKFSRYVKKNMLISEYLQIQKKLKGILEML